MTLGDQIVWLFIMAVPIASVAWTVTQEEVFRELREYSEAQAQNAEQWWKRKFFYVFSCHYCFSHYVTAVFVGLTGYKLLATNWFGYVIAFFALVWVANQYMSFYAWLRQQYKAQKYQAKELEHIVKEELEPREMDPAA
ncbi:MAG: hypothetical protein ACRD3E_13535 [Terriglobales bacterium]